MTKKLFLVVFLILFSALPSAGCQKKETLSASENGITVTIDSLDYSDHPMRAVSAKATITNQSDDAITALFWNVTMKDSASNELGTVLMFWQASETALEPGDSVSITTGRYPLDFDEQPSTVQLSVKEIRTEEDYPLDRIPMPGEYLYQALDDEKLANIQNEPPVKIEAGVDQGGYLRTATLEDDVLEEAVHLFTDVKVGEDNAPMVTDNYNYVSFFWPDGSVSGFRMNLTYLEVFANGTYHSYYLENFEPFWNLVHEYLVDPQQEDTADDSLTDSMNTVHIALNDMHYESAPEGLIPSFTVQLSHTSTSAFQGIIYEVNYYDADHSFLNGEYLFYTEKELLTKDHEWSGDIVSSLQFSQEPSFYEVHLIETVYQKDPVSSLTFTPSKSILYSEDDPLLMNIRTEPPILITVDVLYHNEPSDHVYFDDLLDAAVNAFADMTITDSFDEHDETSPCYRITLLFETGEEYTFVLMKDHLIQFKDGDIHTYGVVDNSEFIDLVESNIY